MEDLQMFIHKVTFECPKQCNEIGELHFLQVRLINFNRAICIQAEKALPEDILLNI